MRKLIAVLTVAATTILSPIKAEYISVTSANPRVVVGNPVDWTGKFVSDGFTLSFGNEANKVPIVGSDGKLVVSIIPTTLNPTTFLSTGVISPFYNKVAITAPATGATLTLADGKTFTVNQTLTLTGTSGGFTGTVPATGTFAMGAGTNSASSTSSTSGANHTHAITTTTTGAASTILALDGSSNAMMANLLAKNATFDLLNTTATTINFGGAASVINLGASTFLKSSNYASQTSGWGINGATGGADFRYLFVDEMHAKSFIADLEQALAGGQIISKSVAMVATNFTVPVAGTAGTLRVRDLPSAPNMAVFQVNDYVVLRKFSRAGGSLTIADAVGTVFGYIDGSGADEGTQSWSWLRASGADAGTMTAGTVIPVDALALDFGTTGNGYYEVNAIDGANAVNSPYAQIVTWTGSPVAANRSVRSRFGKLTGITGTSNEYGMLAGTYSATNGQFFRASNSAFELHGINLLMWDGTTNVIKLDRTAPSFAIGNPLPTAYSTGAGIWMGKDGSAYKFRVGNPAGNKLEWDGSTLNIVGSGTFSGSITATSGSFGGWTINSTYLAKDTGTNSTSAGLAPADYPFFAGSTYANRATAPFRVTPAGALTAMSGSVGGWTVGASTLTGGSVTLDSSNGLIIDSPTSPSDSTAVTWRVGGTVVNGVYGYAASNRDTASTRIDAVSTSGGTRISANSSSVSKDVEIYAGNGSGIGSGNIVNGVVIGRALSPSHMLDVYGNGYFGTNSFNPLSANVVNAGVITDGFYGGGHILKDGTFYAGMWCQDSTYRLGTGTSSGLTAYLKIASGGISFPAYGAGTLTTDASGNITASSDETLKVIEGTFDRGMSDLRGLKPKKGRWTAASGLDTTEQYVWLTAQDLLPHIPEAVFMGPEGKYTVSDRPILDTVVNALNEIDARLAKLEGASAPPPDKTDRKKLAADRIAGLKTRLAKRQAAADAQAARVEIAAPIPTSTPKKKTTTKKPTPTRTPKRKT